MYELRGPFGKRVVGVVGGRTSVGKVDELLKKLKKVDGENETTSQVFDASCIAGVEHLVHSARFALIAHATGRKFASSLNIELLCWAAAERHITHAFEKVGLCEGSENVAILVLGASHQQVKNALADVCRELDITREDSVLELTREKTSKLVKIFSISKEELKIAPIKKLLLERVALLSLES